MPILASFQRILLIDMASRDDASGCGCLAVILIGGVLVIKKVVWPWVYLHKESILTWLTVLAAVAGIIYALWWICKELHKSRNMRIHFDKDYTNWMDGTEKELNRNANWLEQDKRDAAHIKQLADELETEVKKFINH